MYMYRLLHKLQCAVYSITVVAGCVRAQVDHIKLIDAPTKRNANSPQSRGGDMSAQAVRGQAVRGCLVAASSRTRPAGWPTWPLAGISRSS